MRLDLGTEIKLVELINLDTNEKISLFEISGSCCHFRDTIKYENYFIQLRLDWGDLDKYREPTLDADVWIERNGEKIFKRNGVWHHTKKEIDPKTGQWEYTFRFENLELRLVTKKTIAKFLFARANIADSLVINHKESKEA